MMTKVRVVRRTGDGVDVRLYDDDDDDRARDVCCRCAGVASAGVGVVSVDDDDDDDRRVRYAMIMRCMSGGYDEMI